MSYQVALANGQLWQCPVDQLLNDTSQRSDSDVVECDTQESIDIDFPPNDIEPQEEGDPILRRSSRIRRPPDKLTYKYYHLVIIINTCISHFL